MNDLVIRLHRINEGVHANVSDLSIAMTHVKYAPTTTLYG